MKHIIQFPLDNDGVILVEVDEPELQDGVGRVARSGEIVEKATQTFDSAIDNIRPVAATIISKLRDLSTPPDEVEVQFGVKLNAAAGAVLASTGAEANFQISLTWKRADQKAEKSGEPA